jgi:hypothetical protein
MAQPNEQPTQPKKRGHRPPSARTRWKRATVAAKDKLADRLGEVADAALDLALGAYVVLIQDSKGSWKKPPSDRALDIALDVEAVRVYRELPDPRGIALVFERVMGREAQPIDVEVTQVIKYLTADQATLIRILEEHVPEEYLEPVLAELRRVREHHREATAVLPD